MSTTMTPPATTEHPLVGLSDLTHAFPSLAISFHYDDDGDAWAAIAPDTVTDEALLFVSTVPEGLVLIRGDH